MPAVVLYPNSSCLEIMDLMRTDLEDCTVHLFQNDLTPTPSTVLADLEECDFSGYTEKVVTALLPAYIDPAGGASAQIPTQQFDHTGGVVSNMVYGFWVETTGGDLRLVGSFEEAIPMSALGQSIPVDIKFNFGA